MKHMTSRRPLLRPPPPYSTALLPVRLPNRPSLFPPPPSHRRSAGPTFLRASRFFSRLFHAMMGLL